MKILLTDDDLELCELLKEYLEHEDMQVSLCHDGQSAINTINHSQFDLLILDIMMPIKNGFETLSEIRKTSNLPVIMLTNWLRCARYGLTCPWKFMLCQKLA